MGIQVISGATSDILTVDATSKAARVTLYDSAGNQITKVDRSAVVPGTQPGIINAGVDYKTARNIRVSSGGTMRTSDDTVYLFDSVEGAAYNSNIWIQSLTSFTMSQAAATGILFNAGSSVTTGQGAMLLSHRSFPMIHRTGLAMRWKARHTAHGSNTIIESGFGSPTSATSASIVNGACWRKDGSGQYVPVLVLNTGTDILGTPISDATFVASVPTTDYAHFEIVLFDNRAHFAIYTQGGTLVNAQDLEFSGTGTAHFSQTRLQAMHRVYNSGAAGAAVQMLVHGTVVVGMDSLSQRDWRSSLSGNSLNSLTSPTAYTQLANWTNSGAPTTRTLSNTAAAETTLGGILRANSIAGGTTDLIMFGWQNGTVSTGPVFYCTGIYISVPMNEVVAVATTATVFSYFAAFNSSAVSLATAAPYAPKRVALPGVHTAAVATAANTLFSGNTIVWTPATPMPVYPSRFLHVGCRELVGTATATETYYWHVAIDGYFE